MTKTDIAFWKDDAHTFLPWVVGIMAALATLMLCFGLSVGSWMVDRTAAVPGSFTVNLPSNADNISKKIPQVTDILLKTDGVTSVNQLSDDTLRILLKPWFGNSDAINELPLPIVLDVHVSKTAKLDYKALHTALAAIVEGVEIDTHEGWVDSFVQFSRALRALLCILAFVIFAGLALIIAFMSRSAMKLHARTVHLLHSIGAEDRYITRQFQSEAGLLTLRGTLPGCIIGGLTYWVAGMYIASLKSSLPPLSMTSAHITLIALTPLICGSIAWVTARFSVFEQLKRSM